MAVTLKTAILYNHHHLLLLSFFLTPSPFSLPFSLSLSLTHTVMNSAASNFDYFSSSSASSPLAQHQNHRILATFLPPSHEDAAGFRVEAYHQKPKKKRSKVFRIDGTAGNASPSLPRPKPNRRPDPSAPKITPPCTECGKKFWSWKALFGHMRCHPERQWRGIVPPADLRAPPSPERPVNRPEPAAMSEEDHEVAASLIMLANGSNGGDRVLHTTSQGFHQERCSDGLVRDAGMAGSSGGGGGEECRFECSSCKKVFGSHQALGGHRASHKNVKGCFAITRGEFDDEIQCGSGFGWGETTGSEGEEKMGQHRCSICLKVFTSGQALGGHKRCHWEKGEDQPLTLFSQLGQNQSLSKTLSTPRDGCGCLDLNLPAPLEDDWGEASSSSYSSGVALDLRLGM